MFEAKLGKAEILKKLVDAIKDLVNDAPFDCSEGALSLQAMDSSHVALVSLKMEAHGFESYRCDRTQNLGVSLPTLAKFLKCAGNDDNCTLRYQDESDQMILVFDDTDRDKQQECEMKLMDLDTEHLGIPEQDYAAVISMPSAEFKKACSDVSMFTDTLQIIATKSGVQFCGKGDTGTHTVRWGQDASAGKEEDAVTVDVTEPVNITFAIKYMNHFAKATPLCSKVSLSVSNDVPVAVEYKIGETADAEGFGYLRFYLAPKIEEEGMDADR